ncbi:uncharacterized protein NPIL_385721 [Nephila pilipes]|uniref:Uncharacterized protein n=1 Tax=Nephila pilipes TaxID=299642 RepID=A0A8X6PFM2_NEPPI|nr:uncharacterized protein NPIL_385721 [Nephila pilipes]
MILSCWIELLPTSGHIMPSNTPIECRSLTQSEQTDTPNLKHQGTEDQEKMTVELTKESEIMNSDIKPRLYRLRNWKKDVSNEKCIQRCPAPFDASSIMPMEKIREYNFGNNEFSESDPTKIYYFPFRQKRSEQWIDTKETRPCKIRNSESNVIENPKLATPLPEESTQKIDDYSTEHSSSGELEIPKSYSFPFRRKRLQQWIEIQEKGVKDSDISPDMLPFKTSHSGVIRQETRRRRSFSGSEFDLERANSPQKREHKDFSQSVEISKVSYPRTVNTEMTKNGSTAFSRLKVGLANCLSKCKKDNCKLGVKSFDNKKRHFKSFF